MSGRRPRPTPRQRADVADGSVPVTVVSGLDRLSVDDLVTGLLLRADRVASVYADPSPASRGYVLVRMHDTVGMTRARLVELDHDCASCTLRAATVAALTHLAGTGDYDALVLQLHPGIEPDAALRGLIAELPSGVAHADSHATVVPGDWLAVLAGDSGLRDHDAAVSDDDDRFAATLLSAGIETATTIVLRPSGTDVAEERAVLDLLAPAAVRLRLSSVLDVPEDDLLATGRLDARRLDPLAAYGIRDPRRGLGRTESLTLVRWQATRPLHPLRLHQALDQLADGVIRSSGRLYVADQPDSVVGWDSAGASLLLGPIAPCHDSPSKRVSRLAFLGDELDAAGIHHVLDGCLLTDDELAIVSSSWNDVSELLVGRTDAPSDPPPPATRGDTAA